jgi:hypothetical protein
VKSAYHMARASVVQASGECSRALENCKLWNDLWTLKVPAVVKVFLWKACNNLLPTQENLFKRKVSSDPLCPICGVEVETISHILWSCPSSSDVWGACSKKIQKCSIAAMDFTQMLGQLLVKMEKEDIEFLATVARRIWLRRNSFVFGGDFLPPNCLIKNATEAWEEFYAAEQKVPTAEVHSPVCPVPTWKAPPWGVFKINWDAAIDKSSKMMGVGVIVRDGEGEVIAACTPLRCTLQIRLPQRLMLHGKRYNLVEIWASNRLFWKAML